MSRWFQLVLLNDAINDDADNDGDDEGTDDDDDDDGDDNDDDDSVTDAALTRLRTRRNFLISWTDRFSKFEISKAVPFFSSLSKIFGLFSEKWRLELPALKRFSEGRTSDRKVRRPR